MRDVKPDFSLEMAMHAEGCGTVAGVDEVGRGPWAGPVVAAAIVLAPGKIPAGLNDSKKLSAKRRELLHEEIEASADIGIGEASVEEIDWVNILQASFLAMIRAVQALPNKPDHLLIDGKHLPPELPCPGSAIVGGDGRSLSIAAASIVAKVTRDRAMVVLSQQFPGYGWHSNMGYGTKTHQIGLSTHGVTQHHRKSFKPIHNMLSKAKPLSD